MLKQFLSATERRGWSVTSCGWVRVAIEPGVIAELACKLDRFPQTIR